MCRAEVSRMCVECDGTVESMKKAESILKDVSQSLQLKSTPLCVEQALATGNVEAVERTGVSVKRGNGLLVQSSDGLALDPAS